MLDFLMIEKKTCDNIWKTFLRIMSSKNIQEDLMNIVE